MKKIQNKQQGFTIIEVVLVLAIAGLIFMVVFLALPGLQRSQRDTQRKQDVGRFVSQVTTYQGNNKGKTPCAGETTTDPDAASNGGCLTDVKTGLTAGGSSFIDPSTGEDYILEFLVASATATKPELGHMQYARGVSCSSDGITTDSADPGAFAVATLLNDGSVYCQQG
jgi:prepilin-type N-terminal cleavage/methylation domain-containing protein